MVDPLSTLLPSIDPYGTAVGVMNGVTMFSIIMIFAVIGIFAWKKKMFAKWIGTAEIFKMYGGVLSYVDSDKVRRVKKKVDGVQKEFYDFKNRNIVWQPPSFEQIVSTGKRKFKIYLEELSHDTFRVLDMSQMLKMQPGEGYKGIQSEVSDRQWREIQHEAAVIKHAKEDKWANIRNMAPTLIVVGMVVILLIFGVDAYVKMAQASNAGAGQVAEALKLSTEMMNQSLRYMEFLGYHGNTSTTTVIK